VIDNYSLIGRHQHARDISSAFRPTRPAAEAGRQRRLKRAVPRRRIFEFAIHGFVNPRQATAR